VDVQPRTRPLSAGETLTVDTLAMAAYEAGRPPAETACRVGDERFLVSTAAVNPSASGA
jgi:hydrogenase maturation protease